MGTFRLQIPSTGTIEDNLARLPSQVRSVIREGFRILSRIPKAHLEGLRTAVIESIQAGSPTDEGHLAGLLDITPDDARVLLGSMSLVASFVSARETTAEQFVNSATALKLIDPQAKDAALSFIAAVSRERSVLKHSIEQSTISSQVLPSLMDYDVSVDVRLAFEKGRVSDSVPVALIHIDTDAMNEELWFQANKKQLEKFIRELQEAVQKMNEAEKWASKNRRTEG